MDCSSFCVKGSFPLAEESKVKLKKPVSLAWRPQKRGANRVAHFLHSVFKEQAPPQSGEGSLLRWFWSSPARVGPWQTEPALPSWFVPQPAWSSTGCSTSSVRDKSKVPGGQKDSPRPFPV